MQRVSEPQKCSTKGVHIHLKQEIKSTKTIRNCVYTDLQYITEIQ